MNSIIKKQKQNASLAVNKLPLPSFSYGPNMRSPINLDFDHVFNNLECSTKNKSSVKIESPDEINVYSLSELDEEFIQKNEILLSTNFSNKMIAQHYSKFEDALVIYVPEGFSSIAPIKINSHFSKEAILQNIIVIASKNSKAIIIEEVTSEKNNIFQSQIVDLYTKDNSDLTYILVDNSGDESHKFISKNHFGSKDSQVTFVDVLLGGKFQQLLLESNLNQEGSQTKMYPLFYGRASQVFDINSSANHYAQNTQSNIVSRNILNDFSKATFRGCISIDDSGKNSKASLHNKTLLLGENSSCNAVPILDVIPNDVECSHGVAIGKIDKKSLFYLNSRGIDKNLAMRMIVEGTLTSALETLKNKEGFDKIIESIKHQISKKIGN